jgi:AcrR family transcriptional regulator
MTVHSLRARFKETVSGAILDAAEELAADVGVPAANLQAVAKRAGVAVGTIYNHFEDRNELFAELFARRTEELLATLDAASKAAGPGFETQLRAYVHSVFSYFDTRRAFLRLAFDGQTPKPPVVGKRGAPPSSSMPQLTLRAEKIVRAGLKEKRLRTDMADLAAPFLTAAIRAVLIARIDEPKPLAGETARVMSLFLEGSSR